MTTKMTKGICTLATIFMMLGAFDPAHAATKGAEAKGAVENYISYLSADWGPDGDTIYFIKQIITTKAGDTAWLGSHFWLCKMKWDGTEKREISELWPGQNALVLLQGSPLWMEVNAATSNVAFSVEYGNESGGGLWLIGLNGKNQRRPFPLVWNKQARWAPLHPSWSPDGTKIVYEEDDRTMPTSSVTRLVLFDLQTKERKQLTKGPRDQHPVWSPKGDWIVFTHYLQYDHQKSVGRSIWLIRPDGSEQKPMVDEEGKTIFGWWPSWNPEGTIVSITSGVGLEFASITNSRAKWIDDPLPILGESSVYTFLGHHWGKHGWLLSAGSIRLIYLDMQSARFLAKAGVYKTSDPNSEEARWGSIPQDIPKRASR